MGRGRHGCLHGVVARFISSVDAETDGDDATSVTGRYHFLCGHLCDVGGAFVFFSQLEGCGWVENAVEDHGHVSCVGGVFFDVENLFLRMGNSLGDGVVYGCFDCGDSAHGIEKGMAQELGIRN